MTTTEQKALFRFQVIHPLLDSRLGKGELTRMVREASERELCNPRVTKDGHQRIDHLGVVQELSEDEKHCLACAQKPQ